MSCLKFYGGKMKITQTSPTLKISFFDISKKSNYRKFEDETNCEDCYYNPQCRKCGTCLIHCRCVEQ